MKTFHLVLIILVFYCSGLAQNSDLIVTSDGGSIACKIGKISKKHINYSIKKDDKWFLFQFEKNRINDYWINSNKKMYKTWLTLKSEPFKSEGILYQSKESSILIVPLVKNEQQISDKSKIEFQISNIETIKLRRKNKIGRDILVGAVTGLVAGGLIGFADGDDPSGLLSWSAEFKAALIGGSLAVCGAGIGAAVGLVKIKIPINGSSEKYKKNKSSLRRYAVKN